MFYLKKYIWSVSPKTQGPSPCFSWSSMTNISFFCPCCTIPHCIQGFNVLGQWFPFILFRLWDLRSINLYIADMKSRCFQIYFFLNCELFLISCILHCLSLKFYCMHFYKSINFKGPLNARFTIKIISLRWKFIDVTKLLNPFFV